MPGLYRSKSVRRLDENNQFREIIERDNKKILAAASCQLFISTPQLDKWFKSSTGTLCFLKDHSRKGCYFFRLYSLIQGQLWEQEIHAPYSYVRLSYVFHYVTVNRFNFGFKFICEDEAERFYNVIKKFQTDFNCDNDYSVPNLPSTQVTTLNTTNKLEQQGLQLNDILSIASMNATPPLINTRKSRKLQATSSISSIVSTNSSTIKTTTPPTNTSLAQKIRNLSHSADRVKKIDKNDISCPFRCSYTDLHLESEKRPQVMVVAEKALAVATPLQRTSSVNSPLMSTSTRLVPQTPHTPRRTPSIKKVQAPVVELDEGELEITKELLMKFNLPINKKFIRLLREYIKPYGNMQAFKEAIQHEEEKKKLSAFVAATNASLIAQNPLLSPVQTLPLSKYPAPTPPISPMVTSSSTPIKQQQVASPLSINTSCIGSPAMNTHGTFISSTRHQINNQLRRRTETPSPVRSKITYKPSIKPTTTSNQHMGGNEAPPKPPRRSSLKIMV